MTRFAYKTSSGRSNYFFFLNKSNILDSKTITTDVTKDVDIEIENIYIQPSDTDNVKSICNNINQISTKITELSSRNLSSSCIGDDKSFHTIKSGRINDIENPYRSENRRNKSMQNLNE